MHLTSESVQEFIEIYKAEYGEEITYVQGEEMGTELLGFYSAIRPTHNNNHNNPNNGIS